VVSTWTALGIVLAILVLNQIVMRVPALWQRPSTFWANLTLQATAAVTAAIVGLPGADAMPAIRWLLAGLFAFHVVQDLSVRSTRLRAAAEGPADDEGRTG
jgi:hypothetical protein